MLGHYFSITTAKTGIVCRYEYYFRYQSFSKLILSDAFANIYGVINFESNDKQALYSRIDFIQRNEPRSNYNYTNNDEIS